MLPTLFRVTWFTFNVLLHQPAYVDPLEGFWLHNGCDVDNPIVVMDPDAREYWYDVAALRESCSGRVTYWKAISVSVFDPNGDPSGNPPPTFESHRISLWGSDMNQNGVTGFDDLVDYLLFSACYQTAMAGAPLPPNDWKYGTLPPDCEGADLDITFSVDAADWLLFAAWFTGNGPY